MKDKYYYVDSKGTELEVLNRLVGHIKWVNGDESNVWVPSKYVPLPIVLCIDGRVGYRQLSLLKGEFSSSDYVDKYDIELSDLEEFMEEFIVKEKLKEFLS